MKYECECGFKFAGPGEIRNCAAFIDNKGRSCVVCPDCGKTYANILEEVENE